MACASCNKSKTSASCGICSATLCKKCVQAISPDAFLFLRPLPEKLTHSAYCGPCYVNVVAPEELEHGRVLGLARKVMVYERNQGEETRLMKRKEKPLSVSAAPDRADAMLWLAFLAAKAGFNALLDVSIHGKKVRNADGYQHMEWDGTGVPTNLDREKIEHSETYRFPSAR